MKYESSFKSEADGLEISVMALIPDKKPYRAVVQLVHGMSEHKERYIPFMQYLAKLGYVVVIHDHRGHGKSVKHQDDLGFTYGGGAQAMLQDIRTVNRKIHAYYPELPLILMGHSMGSLAVRAFVAEHDSCVDMLIVCGSPSYNTAMPLGPSTIYKTRKACTTYYTPTRFTAMTRPTYCRHTTPATILWILSASTRTYYKATVAADANLYKSSTRASLSLLNLQRKIKK